MLRDELFTPGELLRLEQLQPDMKLVADQQARQASLFEAFADEP